MNLTGLLLLNNSTNCKLPNTQKLAKQRLPQKERLKPE